MNMTPLISGFFISKGEKMAERENTNNAIPSNALKDLKDNTIILDEWTNSKSDYTQDRFGVKFKTRYKILNDLQTSINNIQSSSFLRLSGGTLTGSVTGTDFTGNNITAKTSLTVGSAKAKYSTTGLNFDKPLLINNVEVLKVGDYGLGTAGVGVFDYDNPSRGSGFYTTTTGVTGNPAFAASNVIEMRRGVTSRSALAWNPYNQQVMSGRFNGTTWMWSEIITTTNISNYQSTSVTILYPGGSEASPPTISRNTRIIIDNPYKTLNCIVKVEFFIKNLWAEAPKVQDTGSNYGRGCSATAVSDNTIVVQTGGTSLTTSSNGDGNPWQVGVINDALYRIRVIKLGD